MSLFFATTILIMYNYNKNLCLHNHADTFKNDPLLINEYCAFFKFKQYLLEGFSCALKALQSSKK